MFDTHRSVRLNRKYLPLWQTQLSLMFPLVGFRDSSPTEYSFAEGVRHWQSHQRPSLIADDVLGPKTWARMQVELNSGAVKATSAAAPGGRADTVAFIRSRVGGPQCFAPGKPGEIPLDGELVARNQAIERKLLDASSRQLTAGDMRWFFAFAHAQITKQINRNLIQFQEPNALMALNVHFAEEFLRALAGC